MLDYAYFYQDELYTCLKETLKDKNLYFYLMFPSKFFSFRIYENDKNAIQFISKNSEGKIIGFLSAYADNENNVIQNMDFINFTGKPNPIFSHDTVLFFDEIFINRNFRKIIFNAIAENPAVNMYRKLVRKFDGKEVGILKENKKLTDGKYYDEIIFEIYRNNYIKTAK